VTLGAHVEWGMPGLLWIAALTPLLLLLGLRRDRARVVPTGTLALWRELDLPGATGGDDRRRRPRLWLIATTIALLALTLALAEPRRVDPRVAPAWQVVIRPDPGWALAFTEGGVTSGATRWEHGLEAARGFLERHAPGAEVSWRYGDRQFDPGRPAIPNREPTDFDAGRLDLPGTLLVLPSAPTPRPRRASWIAVGGGAVPGPVGPDPGPPPTLRVFDGSGLVARAPAGDAVVAEGELPAPVLGVLEDWAASRGFVLARAGDPRPDVVWLVVSAAATQATAATGAAAIEVGRDGWSVRLDPPAAGADQALPDPDEAGWRPWLLADGHGVVRWRPGRVLLDARSWSLPAGPAPAFALSFARLFDGALLAPPGRAPVSARADQGVRATGLGELPAARSGADRPLAAWPAALAAAMLALAALSFPAGVRGFPGGARRSNAT
jgi:hypothetical protein